MQFKASEMKLKAVTKQTSPCIQCIPFEKRFFEEYKRIYNESFYDMRKSLDIKPYNVLTCYEQIRKKSKDIFLYFMEGELKGSVACYGSEIDDLFVKKSDRNKGIGKQLLLWAIRSIKSKTDSPVTLHVAECNQSAVKLYERTGFLISKTVTITL